MKKQRSTFANDIISSMSNFIETLKRQTTFPGDLKVTTLEMTIEPPIKNWKPKKIAELRESLGASQFIFATFLGVSVKTVHAWEQGINKPSGIACRFLSEMQHDPAHWKKRLAELAKVRPAG